MAKAPLKAPNPQASEQNTTETNIPRNEDEVARNEQAVKMVVSRTGQVVENVPVLVAETRDQLYAEKQQEKYIDNPEIDTLTAEQLDHQRTLAHALGLNSSEDNDAARKVAEAYVAKLKDKERDTSKDNRLNSVPSNYIIEPLSEGKIRATNRFTGRVFEGNPSDLLK